VRTGPGRFPPTISDSQEVEATSLNTAVLSIRVPQVLVEFLSRAGMLYADDAHHGLSAGQLARLMIENAVEQLDRGSESNLCSSLQPFFDRLNVHPNVTLCGSR
jgi:hypothetical protein